MYKYHYIIIFTLLVSFVVNAQNPVQHEEHELSLMLNPWLKSANAAGLGQSEVKAHAITELGYFWGNGNYHRAQEGDGRNGLNFYSERFDRLSDKIVVWGSFQFIMDREKNRAWSDVFTTYNNNPYIFGSSVKGNYDRQLFDFKAKLSTENREGFNFGLGIDYKVGDLSRLRDPRTRIFLADYAAIPSLTYNLNENNVIGLNVSARFVKEKMPNITTVQDDPNLRYYTFVGMEYADAVIGGYKAFQRQFVSNIWGGDLQYAFNKRNSKLVFSLGSTLQQQDILEDIKQTPGSYKAVNYNGSAIMSIQKKSVLWNASLTANLKQGAANENLQELISVNDPVTGVNSKTWVTLYTYKNRYMNNVYDVNLKLELCDVNESMNDSKWKAGFEAGVNGFKNSYYLPYSEFSANKANVSVFGDYRVFNKGNFRITLNANVGYEFGFDNSLLLSEGAMVEPEIGATTFKRGTYDVAKNILMPDFYYFGLDVLNCNLGTRISFPLKIKKTVIIGYIKGYYNPKFASDNLSWTNTGISFGILP